ncbi:hypothetical protein D3C78_1696070 [compost metagenome]
MVGSRLIFRQSDIQVTELHHFRLRIAEHAAERRIRHNHGSVFRGNYCEPYRGPQIQMLKECVGQVIDPPP